MISVASAISVAIKISSSRSRMRRNINVPLQDRPRHCSLVTPIPLRPLRPQSPSIQIAQSGQRKGLPRRRTEALRQSSLVGRAPRLLEEFVDQRLADALCHILVDRFERLAHRRILLRRQRDDLALAGLLDLRQRVVVFLLPTGRCRSRWLPSWPSRAGRGCRPAGRPRTSCWRPRRSRYSRGW